MTHSLDSPAKLQTIEGLLVIKKNNLITFWAFQKIEANALNRRLACKPCSTQVTGVCSTYRRIQVN